MSLEKRLDRLGDYCPKQRRIEDMTDDELAELVTGIPPHTFRERHHKPLGHLSALDYSLKSLMMIHLNIGFCYLHATGTTLRQFP